MFWILPWGLNFEHTVQMKFLSFLCSLNFAAALQYWRLWQIWLYYDWKIWGLWSEAIHNSLRTVMINHLPLPYKPLSHRLWSNDYIKYKKSLQQFGEIGTHCHIKQTLWILTNFQIHAVPLLTAPFNCSIWTNKQPVLSYAVTMHYQKTPSKPGPY